MKHLGGLVIAWRVVRNVVCHPGIKRFVGLHCFSGLSVQPYGIWALPRWSKLWVQPVMELVSDSVKNQLKIKEAFV